MRISDAGRDQGDPEEFLHGDARVRNVPTTMTVASGCAAAHNKSIEHTSTWEGERSCIGRSVDDVGFETIGAGRQGMCFDGNE